LEYIPLLQFGNSFARICIPVLLNEKKKKHTHEDLAYCLFGVVRGVVTGAVNNILLSPMSNRPALAFALKD
jgi:hypothetical protein